MGSDENCKYLPMFSLSYVKYRVCVRLWFLIVLYKLRHVWCVPSTCIAA